MAVREFSLFGSILREDFRDDSDVDVLVSFEENPAIGLWDMAEMMEELEGIFGRKVDLVEKEGLRNPYRKHAILSAREIVYAVCTIATDSPRLGTTNIASGLHREPFPRRSRKPQRQRPAQRDFHPRGILPPCLQWYCMSSTQPLQ